MKISDAIDSKIQIGINNLMSITLGVTIVSAFWFMNLAIRLCA